MQSKSKNLSRLVAGSKESIMASWNVREKACESSKTERIYKSRQAIVALEIEYKAFMYN